jgi:two-component system, chemotaxis family, sensor kinase CheA
MFQDDELLQEFVVESAGHLAEVEGQLLQIEAGGDEINSDLVNTVFRAIHSVKGAAGFLGLTVINSLAHNLENVLNMVRNRELMPSSPIINALLRAADQLRLLVDDVATSNDVDVTGFIRELEAIERGQSAEGSDVDAATSSVASDTGDIVVESAKTLDVIVESIAEALPAIVAATPVAPPVAAASSKSAVAKPKPQSPAAGAADPTSAKQAKATDSIVRVNVALLDRLMNLAGELVLSRNQLLLAVSNGVREGLENIASRVDQVTSELQETIMQTRMQPIGTVFGKFPRVVRDLSAKLNKECNLEIEGNEVEVDKTIVEAMGDPLTHLVRNSVDHGIERPEQRLAKGKPRMGEIKLRAFHQAGKVCIRIEDNGGGMDPEKLKAKALEKGLISQDQASMMTEGEALRLIFAPGFSTAAQVTDVSGRGVGMDVVRTNIEQLGGTVDVESKPGEGSAIHITLPLTLAIIPSMIVGCSGERYAVPQANILELVRVPEAEIDNKIGRVHGAEVLRLRGALLPLVRLDSALGLRTADQLETRPKSANILVLETGQMRYGLVVDTLHDNEEIVVKPLGKHVKELGYLAGATILGDGYVALILDVVGMAVQSNLRNIESAVKSLGDVDSQALSEESHRLLLFANHPTEQFAVPMAMVARIERIKSKEVKVVGNQNLLIYRGNSLPLMIVEQNITALPPDGDIENLFVIVFRIDEREVGLIAPILRDIRDIEMKMDARTLREPGVPGATVVDGVTTRLLDVIEMVRTNHPEWCHSEKVTKTADPEQMPTIMLAEDSDFFRNHVKRTLESEGYKVVGAADGQSAWEQLQTIFDDIDLLITDIEMPRMNGLELAKAVRSHTSMSNLPIIALTSLASKEDEERGTLAGIDEYQAKMDSARLMEAVRRITASV